MAPFKMTMTKEGGMMERVNVSFTPSIVPEGVSRIGVESALTETPWHGVGAVVPAVGIENEGSTIACGVAVTVNKLPVANVLPS
jgi:hypothetical protein